MKYFKKDNTVYAYDDEQLAQGLADDKTPMTDEEVELHINPIPTEAELALEILRAKIVEARAYLTSTDFKMTTDYDEDVTDIKAKRTEARAFIRANS